MKKNLLLIAAFAAAVGASAQSTYCFIDNEALGIPTASTTTDPFVMCENEYGKLSMGATQDIKAFTPCAAPYSEVAVAGGDMVNVKPGITGSNNPDASWGAAPTSGMWYKLETTAKADGFITIITKLNTNKNYWVLRGAQSFCPYRLGFAGKSAKTDNQLLTFEYTIPHNEYDELDQSAADFTTHFIGDAAAPQKPQVPWTVIGRASDSGEGTGFIQFPVFADFADVFYIYAQGSKMACDGFIYTPKAEGDEFPSLSKCPQVVLGGVEKVDEASGDVTPAPEPITFPGYTVAAGSESGIADIIVNETIDENAPMFNVLGQQVDASYKGLVIKNGKKFMNR